MDSATTTPIVRGTPPIWDHATLPDKAGDFPPRPDEPQQLPAICGYAASKLWHPIPVRFGVRTFDLERWPAWTLGQQALPGMSIPIGEPAPAIEPPARARPRSSARIGRIRQRREQQPARQVPAGYPWSYTYPLVGLLAIAGGAFDISDEVEDWELVRDEMFRDKGFGGADWFRGPVRWSVVDEDEPPKAIPMPSLVNLPEYVDPNGAALWKYVLTVRQLGTGSGTNAQRRRWTRTAAETAEPALDTAQMVFDLLVETWPDITDDAPKYNDDLGRPRPTYH